MPSYAAPPPTITPAPAAPTVDNSAEVAKAREIEQARALRMKGLAATDLTKGDGVQLKDESIQKPEATKTLLGQ